MRVVIVAENASRRYGGEAILPVHYLRLLRDRGVDTWLIVHARVRSELTSLFPDCLDHIRFVEDMPLQKLFFALSHLLPRRVSESTLLLANQLLTQYAQRAIVRELVLRHSIDLVHQPIPVSPRFPSLLWDLGAPVIIGPLNGGMEYPAAFRHTESALSRAAISFGRGLSDLFNRLLPGKLKASVVLVANQRTRAALPSGILGRVVEFPENGVDLSQWQLPPATPNFTVDRGRFLFIGRLVDFKALDIAIHAIQLTPGVTLDVIGGGPMEATWRALAAELNVHDRVRFLGHQTQAVCAQHLAAATALVLPSIYECGGAVVLEAMAMGKPVIATNWGGPADYLDPTCGILIDPRTPELLIQGFASAMQRLLSEPATCLTLGRAGRQRILDTFDWNRKIETILSLYAETLITPL